MSGSLNHSPAQIIAQLLIDLSVGTDPASETTWPVYNTSLPDSTSSDNAICVYDTTGEMDSRMMIGGEWEERYGINIRIRSSDHVAGVAKMNALAVALDTQVQNAAVAMTTPTSVYAVQSVSRRSGPFDNGPEPTSGRRVFTVNYLASLRQVS